jgi:transposase-like protein
LQPRRRAEQAFVSVIADACLAGVPTRRAEKLVQQLVSLSFIRAWERMPG